MRIERKKNRAQSEMPYVNYHRVERENVPFWMFSGNARSFFCSKEGRALEDEAGKMMEIACLTIWRLTATIWVVPHS